MPIKTSITHVFFFIWQIIDEDMRYMMITPASPDPSPTQDVNQYPYECSQCFKRYSSQAGLKSHMLQHTGNFRFWCEQCQRGFPNKGNYQAHMDKHEGITFPCNKCDKRFNTKKSLRYHQSKHTGVYIWNNEQ